jgi:hypothetical protein
MMCGATEGQARSATRWRPDPITEDAEARLPHGSFAPTSRTPDKTNSAHSPNLSAAYVACFLVNWSPYSLLS